MSHEEFTAYVEANYDRWVRFAGRRVNQAAEELVQAMVLHLWRMHDTIDPATANALAFTSLRNLIVSHWRKQAAAAAREQEASKSEADRATPAGQAHLKEQADFVRERFAEATEQLTQRQRGAMAVRLVLRLPREEASKYLTITKSAYSALIHQGETRLARALAPHGEGLAQATVDLGPTRVFDELAEAFREDLPERRG